jgi:hypothetical protein
MKTCSRTALQLAALFLVMSVPSFAADNTYLYIVHGIPGRDIAATLNPGWPVDISLNGDCYIRGLAFGSTTGPLTLPSGRVEIKIGAANSLLPCSEAPVIDSVLELAADKDITAVAALDGSGAPSLLTFADNLATVAAGEGRITLAHSADAPALRVTLTQLGTTTPITHTYTLNPGKEITVALPVGTYSLKATAGTTTIPLDNVVAENQAVNLTYLVGSAANNSVSLVTRIIRDVF